MVTRFLAPLFLVGLGLSLAWSEQAQPAPAKADPAAVAKLVALLGSDRYEDREAASEALDALGPAALDTLRTALTGRRDLEACRRAADLVERIEKRLESAKLTQPKMVRLIYNDTPVTQAVQDMAKKTGFTIQLEGDQTKFANRKITLDTGEVPFWQAVDQFCLKAGLVERGPVALPDNAGQEMDERRMNMGIMKCTILSEGSRGPRQEMSLVFLDGNPQPAPTYYGGALRVRALPREVSKATAPQNETAVDSPEREMLLTVEISPEPRMGWQDVLSVRVSKVLDEQENDLTAPLPFFGEPTGYDELERLVRLREAASVRREGGNNFSTRVPIRLKAPKGLWRLKEIHGSVAAEILTPPRPLITVEDVLNVKDRTVRGHDGGFLKVTEIKRDDKGHVTLSVVVEKPPELRKPFVCMPPVCMPAGGTPGERQPIDVSVVGKTLSLVDGKGESHTLVVAEARVSDGDNGGAMEYRLTFETPAGVGEPAKLVYTGQRHTTIDVPFVLKDVPLE